MSNCIIYTFDELSQLAEDIRCNSLVITSNQENKTKVTNLLQYMNDQGCKYLLTISCQNIGDSTKELISQINEIEISKQVIEDLYSKNLLNSSEIESHLGNIEIISTKLVYPSSFDSIYNQLISLKSKLSSQTRIIITVFISGISEIDEKFSHYTNVDNIEIDSTVTTIRNNSFTGCSSLKKLIIPSFITLIEDNALEGLTPSTQIILPPPDEINDPHMLFYFGFLYLKGEEVEQNYEKAKGYLEKSGNLGNSSAFYNLSIIYLKSEDAEKNYSKGIEYFEKSGFVGDPDVLYNIGAIYLTGEGVEKNCTKARKYFEKSSLFGNSDALFSLGVLYEKGEGVEQNYEKARKFFERSGQLGNPKALYFLGVFYEKGEGVEQNYNKAKRYYEKSSILGNTEASFNLGRIYLIENNYDKAIEYFEKSGEINDSYVLFSLGVIVLKGKEKNYEKAAKYFERAVACMQEELKLKRIMRKQLNTLKDQVNLKIQFYYFISVMLI